ncbi:MAG: hypothetical protein HY369_00560 [Candidatus Aenigmarchaeota archaeon]|nr:hypothetical protein [Candidatus Aenigmarchaeota archaeon]
MGKHRRVREVKGIIDPNRALAIADAVIQKRWPGVSREQFLGMRRTGEIELTGVAADVASILHFWGPLAARGNAPADATPGADPPKGAPPADKEDTDGH